PTPQYSLFPYTTLFRSQRFRQRRIFENVAFDRRAAFAIERVGLEKRAGKSFVKFRPEVPVKRDQFGYGKTFFGMTNRRREIVARSEEHTSELQSLAYLV